jgi:hypothetical protein
MAAQQKELLSQPMRSQHALLTFIIWLPQQRRCTGHPERPQSRAETTSLIVTATRRLALVPW